MDDNQSHIELSPQPEATQTVSESDRGNQIVAVPPNGESVLVKVVAANRSSPRKIAANRQNAQKSTGPKTSVGKATSSWNSTRHGLLSTRLPLLDGQSRKQFTRLLHSLKQDLEPVGTLEEILVEKIAQEYWRLGVAAWYEADDLADDSPFKRSSIERITRYQTTINRQFNQDMNQLERLQRLRKGEEVPAPLTLQVTHDTPTISDQNNSEDKVGAIEDRGTSAASKLASLEAICDRLMYISKLPQGR